MNVAEDQDYSEELSWPTTYADGVVVKQFSLVPERKFFAFLILQAYTALGQTAREAAETLNWGNILIYEPQMNSKVNWLSAILLSGTLVLETSIYAQARPGQKRIDRGHELFLKHFEAEHGSTKRDGLGPMFNARSCASCHSQGGTGGAGNSNVNVQILSAMPNPRTLGDDHKAVIRNKLRSIHPAFAENGSIILHRASTNPKYAAWRESILGLVAPEDLTPQREHRIKQKKLKEYVAQGPVKKLPEIDGIPMVLTERNTPSLFGASQIDSISAEAIMKLAEAQAAKGDGITGRVSKIEPDVVGTVNRTSTVVGRFGWRGQMETLRDFVLTACAVECGMQVQDRLQSEDPLDPSHKISEADLSFQEVEELIAFVESLEPPPQLTPVSTADRTQVSIGRSMFQTVGCASCHLPDLDGVRGIFSDLLLHDMGAALSDPMPALPGLRVARREQFFGGYMGGVRDVFATVQDEAAFREWRTPPLWSVRDTAPYMHDGRAANLHEAILAHGGEAENSAARYVRLPDRNKHALIRFLLTIGAPNENINRPANSVVFGDRKRDRRFNPWR